MGIRKYKPTTPGRRGSSVADFVEITRSQPEKSLVRPLSKSGGRENTGKVTTRHNGGGPKQRGKGGDAAHGRRPQARLPGDRLPSSRQGRRAGAGRAHRVRPE